MIDHCKLIIFHYHFLTGGVTTVVRQAVEAFRAHMTEIRSIELVAGVIPEAFRQQMDRYAGKCTVVPQIGYSQPAGGAATAAAANATAGSVEGYRKQVAEQAGRLAERLLSRFGSDDSVWWVHNYHLGKNPVFTQALLEIIHSGRPQRIILQIHDFPECGRFQNLGILKQSLSLDPYPASPWVRYAVLNQRDRTVLTAAGIPESAVFLLENPVLRSRPTEGGESIAPALKRLFGSRFPRYDPRAPVLLYPIRTIRRKNALEALLLCLLLNRTANILITLPGISAAERGYSDLVEGLFAERLCPGLWGIGSDLEEQGLGFGDLVAGSDLVLSTSVQEGFGYLFINSLLWSLPLAARDLDTLAGVKDLFQEYPACFYDTIRVPVSDSPSLAEAYRRKIQGLSGLIPEAERERLLATADTLVRDGLVDFSFLPVPEQNELLRKIAAGQSAALKQCRQENGAVLSKIEDLLSPGMKPAAGSGSHKSEEVDARFGAAAYAAGFQRIIGSFDSLSAAAAVSTAAVPTAAVSPRDGDGIWDEVLKAFLKLENLRLIYDY
ncbi:MAG: hypothetical protein JSV89_04020 [Spirochaetaceae bacterium]|nr:MAG: hypothetical protein JSV89_04020 [Spirochaetaceae bacterium]